jgi:hypothetical protein
MCWRAATRDYFAGAIFVIDPFMPLAVDSKFTFCPTQMLLVRFRERGSRPRGRAAHGDHSATIDRIAEEKS